MNRPVSTTASVLGIFLLALLTGNAAAPQGAYHFENLNPGSIVSPGQDSWYLLSPYLGSDRSDLLVVPPGMTGGSQTARGSCLDGVGLFRANDPGYSFRMIQPSEVGYTSTMDVQVMDVAGDYSLMFALGGDGDDAGFMVDSALEIGPQFGLRKRDDLSIPLSFSVRKAGAGGYLDVPVGELAAHGDWLRMRFIVDLIDGTASLSIRNLSSGGAAYHPVPGLQSVPVGMGGMAAGAFPSTWNTMHLDVLTDVAETTMTFAVDNLVPVSDPGGAPLLGGMRRMADDDELIYTFERMTRGSVVQPAQDGWERDLAIASGSTLRDVQAVRRESTHVFGRSDIGTAIYRKNDAWFSYPAVDPNRELVSFVDIQVRDTDAGINAVFHHGADADNNGILHYSETGPGFGLIKNVDHLGRQLSFFYRGAAHSASFIFSPISTLAADGEWLRLRMSMDFEAGLGRLAYLNLSRGQLFFQDVDGMQNLPLELARLPAGAKPEKWNYVYLRFDTLSFGATGDFGMAMDNLVPNSDSHPMGDSFGLGHPFVSLLCDGLIEGQPYRLVHENGVDGERVVQMRFSARGWGQTLLLSPPSTHGFWFIENDD